jgi:carbamoyltransferase
MRAGKVVVAIPEERLTRRKGEMGFPINAIRYVLDEARVSVDELDLVCIANESALPFQKIYRRDTNFSVKDWIEQNEHVFFPKLTLNKEVTAFHDFDRYAARFDGVEKDPLYPFIEAARKEHPENYRVVAESIYLDVLACHFGISRDKVRFLNHEMCHKAYGLYSRPKRAKTALIFTSEGRGDYSSATVSTYQQGRINELWSSDKCTLGRLYKTVTVYLGMRPGHDEYKVMGLAPYGAPKKGREALDFFREIDSVNGLAIERLPFHKDLYFAMSHRLKGIRFDSIAWAVQEYIEEMLVEWVNNAIAQTGISEIVMSGGLAQNIKAMKRLAELDSVTSLWSGPATGDGSLGIGAAWLGTIELAKNDEVCELPDVFLGTLRDPGQEEIMQHVRELGFKCKVEPYKPRRVAELISDGKILATCRGRSEFGMRALGNTSIMADPRNAKTIVDINAKVKVRDFWMPFTPSVLENFIYDYIVPNSCEYSPYMTMAYDTVESQQSNIPAVIHPMDKTARPQFVTKKVCNKYYDEILEFRKITGVAAVLNTSFNMHGEPLVETIGQAFDVFSRTNIDALVFENHIVARD